MGATGNLRPDLAHSTSPLSPTCLLVLVVLGRGPRDGAPFGWQRHLVGVLALHGGQRLLHRLLTNLRVVPLLAVGVPAAEIVSSVSDTSLMYLNFSMVQILQRIVT